MKNMNSYLSLCLCMVLMAVCSFSMQAQTCSIQGGLVLNDGLDPNTIDANDHMQVYVGVYLYEDSNCNGAVDAGEDQIGSTTTNSLGFYEFEVESAGCFVAVPEASNIPPSADFITAGGSAGLPIELSEDDFANGECSIDNFLAYSGGSTTCFGVADGGLDLTVWFNRFTGAYGYVGPTGVSNIEATARDMAGVLFATNQLGSDGYLGTIDINTGAFTAYPNPVGDGLDCSGEEKELNDIDALSFDPVTGELWAAVRQNLFQIDPVSGLVLTGSFDCGDGTSADVVKVSGLAEDWIDDIAIDFNGNMFAINNDDGANDLFYQIDMATGVATLIGTPVDANGDVIEDIEGLSFNNDGTFYATTGDQSSDPTHANKVWEVVINGSDVVMTPIVSFDNVNTDMEGEECLDGPAVSSTNPENIGFCLLPEGCPTFTTGIDIEVSTNGADADLSTGADVPTITEGNTVTWVYTVTNTGTADLIDVVVMDDVTGMACTIAFLAAGDTETCTVTGTAGSSAYANNGSATGTPVDENGNVITDLDPPSDTDPSHYNGEALPCDVAVTADEVCDPESGELTVTYTFSGGDGSYQISGDVVGEFFAGDMTTVIYNDAAVATIEINDENGCSASVPFDFANCVKEEQCDVAVTAEEDCNVDTGELTVTYTFSGGDGSYQVSGAISGEYFEGESEIVLYNDAAVAQVTIDDENGCAQTFDFDFADCLKETQCDVAVTAEENCNEDSGELIVTYTFSGGDGSYVVSGDLAGTYAAGDSETVIYADAAVATIAIDDENGCSDSFDFDFADCIKAGDGCDALNLAEGFVCDPEDGVSQLTVTPEGGTGPYTLTGDIQATLEEGDSFTSFFSGAISLVIVMSDAAGCSESYSIEYDDCVKTGVLDCSAISLTAVEDCDPTTGLNAVTFTVSGSEGPYTITSEDPDLTEVIEEATGSFIALYNGAASPIFNVVTPDCDVEFENFNFADCVKVCNVQLEALASCNDETGVQTVTYTVGGGSEPYTITDADDNVVATVNELGTFSINYNGAVNETFTVTDSGECSESFDVAFEDCVQVIVCDLTLDLVSQMCNTETGSVTVTFDVDNGTAPYSVDGLDGVFVGDDLIYTASSEEEITAFTVTDAEGCEQSYAPFTVIPCAIACEPIAVDITGTDCDDDGELTLSFDIDGGDAPYTLGGDLSGTVSGTTFTETFDGDANIDFTVTDANNCSDSFSFFVEDCEPLTVDLELNKSVDDSNVDQGDEVVYTITVNNDGPQVATGVQVSDVLPDCVSFVSSDPEQGSYDASTGLWNIGTVEVNEFIELTITVIADGTGECCNIAEIVAHDQEDDDSEPNNDNGDQSEDDEDKAVIEIEEEEQEEFADLTLNKTIDDSDVEENELVTYTITVTNDGPDTATGVEVEDDLPSCVDFVSYDSNDGDYSSSNGIWDIGTIAVGETVTLEIVAEVMIDGGSCTNTAEVVDMDQTDTDSTPNNNDDDEDDQDGASFQVIDDEVADLELDKTVDDSSVEIGQEITYTITVTNDGPDDATGVEVEDDLPSCVDFVSSNGDYNAASGIWDIGSLDVGETVELEIVAVVVGPEGCRNTAEIVATDQDDDDSTPNNNDDDEDDQDGASISISIPQCDAEAGTLTGVSEFYCHDEDVVVGSEGFNDDNDFTQAYLLVDAFGIIVDFNTNGDFGNPSAGTYCLHPLNFDGGLEFGVGTDVSTLENGDECVDLGSDCTQIVVLEEVTVVVEDVECDEETGEYTMAFTFLGGLPAFDSSETYEVSGDVNGEFFHNETFTAVYVTNNPFTVSAQDDNGCGASITGVRECTKPAAIELVEFDGRVQENGNFVYWTTAFEENVDFFSIEASTDGQTFERIGDVNAIGFSNVTNSYELLHTEATTGVTYYRLLEVTLDGNVQVASEVIALERSDKGFSIEGVHPVPVVDDLTISLNVSENTVAQIFVYDVTGRIVTTTETDLTIGLNSTTMNLSNITGGAYFLQIVSGDQVQSLKFLKD